MDSRLRSTPIVAAATSTSPLASAASEPHPAKAVYIPALDGVRFLAFALVFLNHAGAPAAVEPFSHAISTALAFGWVGVDIFLCLSGFLIATLLLHEIAATDGVAVSWFYLRRTLRIWPLYYLMLAIGFGIAPWLLGQTGTPAYTSLLAKHLFPFATLFGNLSYAFFQTDFGAMSPSAGFFAPLWTVGLEEQFYLVFPLLLAAFPRPSTRAALTAIGAVLLFSFVTRLYIVGNGIHYPAVWTLTFARLDPIVLGIAGAIVWHRHGATIRRLQLYGAELAAAAGLFWLVMSFPQINLSRHVVWQFLATAAGSLLLIIGVLRYRILSAAFGWRPIAWLGKISYGLYVFHLLVLYLYGSRVASHVVVTSTIRPFVDLVLPLMFTIGVAAVSYYVYERPFLRIKARFAHVASRPV
jgi:peptidoglycan/LPS O-acetylase OafA/YrhL